MAALSFVLATVESGWTRLSRTRLAETSQGPASRLRLERMLSDRDSVEDALIVLRVSSQVALVMLLVVLAQEAVGEAATRTPVILAGIVAFAWITVFCRVLPGEMSVARLEAFVRTTMPVIVLVSKVLGPPIELLRRGARRMTGHTPETEAELYADQVLSHVEEGAREGHLGGEQAEMIEAVLELSDTEVRQLMTPRTEMDAIDVGVTVAEARTLAIATGRSRYPLVDGTVDKVVGILHVKDLLGRDADDDVRVVARDPWFVPESKYCTELLAEFKLNHQHLAVVLDEYGGTSGIVTIEDVLEEIVGEIDDEFDESAEEPELQILDENHAVAQGGMHVDELNDALSIQIPESDDWSTLGGFIFHTLGRLPEEGEELRHANVVLSVASVIDRRIDKVNIEILEVAA